MVFEISLDMVPMPEEEKGILQKIFIFRERTISSSRFLAQVCAPRIALEGYGPDVQGD